ncbi:hypothetical protein B0H16DRAFT_569550 [Mycena metata]|uniref:Uncharacterized protein n=1 Tax=Mycena metata TaxID=1033252 RepID=A0AAD7JDN6_9AGAR|nr:hypothetical protein B0H16DRAFT_569550 [Mycena metata]
MYAADFILLSYVLSGFGLRSSYVEIWLSTPYLILTPPHANTASKLRLDTAADADADADADDVNTQQAQQWVLGREERRETKGMARARDPAASAGHCSSARARGVQTVMSMQPFRAVRELHSICFLLGNNAPLSASHHILSPYVLSRMYLALEYILIPRSTRG